MRARQRFSLLLLPLSFGIASAAWAYPEYRVTIVAPVDSTATDINKAGVVVGSFPFSATSTHAFLNRGRGLVDLGTLRGATSEGVAINDHGKVLGHWTTAAGVQRGFLYYRGEVRDIGVLPGRRTVYSDINNAGYITVSGTRLDDFTGPRSYLRAPDGSLRDIGSLPFANPVTFAYALNSRNQIVGTSGPLLLPDPPLRAFLWTRGVMRDLGDLASVPNAALAINNHGQATGYAALPTGFRDQHAVLFSDGRVIDIDGRTVPGDRFSNGYGINNRGHVVGYSNHLSGFVYRGRRMQSLNALIDPKLHWDIRFPQAINDSGQIAATAYRNGKQYAVRLDLIRPLADSAPELPAGDEAAPVAQEAADAEAQARELVQPVKE